MLLRQAWHGLKAESGNRIDNAAETMPQKYCKCVLSGMHVMQRSIWVPALPCMTNIACTHAHNNVLLAHFCIRKFIYSDRAAEYCDTAHACTATTCLFPLKIEFY